MDLLPEEFHQIRVNFFRVGPDHKRTDLKAWARAPSRWLAAQQAQAFVKTHSQGAPEPAQKTGQHDSRGHVPDKPKENQPISPPKRPQSPLPTKWISLILNLEDTG
jgi:hypothetical protein